jgi:DNA helicase-2/ATP-dependent DNA helicase PcrA
VILTEVQRKAVSSDSNSLIVACPGSGKTRTLVAKSLRCIEEVRDSPFRVACITYTNAAVHEIEYRLRSYGRTGDEDYCDVSTIHSFCLLNVLNHFHELIPSFANGFTVIPPDFEKYREHSLTVLKEAGYETKLVREFENINRDSDGSPSRNASLGSDVIVQFWKLIESQGLIDFPSIVYWTNNILQRHPSFAQNLAARYNWILVDEFQDTSRVQVDIFREIARHGRTKFFLVGDPTQSIFGFAGAQPALLNSFSNEIEANCEFTLAGNFRSCRSIVEHAERLCPRTPRMEAVGEDADRGLEPVYVDTPTAFEAITDYFLPTIDELAISYGKTAILAPWWFKLVPLAKRLREYGVPVVGPGARPYKRSHIFALVGEQLCSFITTNDPRTFHQLEKELFLVLNHLSGKRPFRLYSYEGRVLAHKLARIGHNVRDANDKGVAWLLECANQAASLLEKLEMLPAATAAIIVESASDMVVDMESNDVDTSNLSVDDLGMFADTTNSIELLTMHKAKGREFDAVAIIDLHDGRVPDYRAIRENDQTRIEEGKRLLYVGITRAKRYLMYATDHEHWRNQPSRFISQLGLV